MFIKWYKMLNVIRFDDLNYSSYVSFLSMWKNQSARLMEETAYIDSADIESVNIMYRVDWNKRKEKREK